jgi:hypothetical protein
MNIQFLHNPTNRREQIQGVLGFYIEAIDPTRSAYGLVDDLQYVARMMFMEKDCEGYRPNVVRRALKDHFESPNGIDWDAEPYKL